MKRKELIIIIIFIISLIYMIPVYAATDKADISTFEFTNPPTPQYFIFDNKRDKDEGCDSLKMICLTDENVLELSSENYRDSDAFNKKYCIENFNLYMQYDVSIDGEDNWQYTTEWDVNGSIGGYTSGYESISLNDEMMNDFELFWLTYYDGEGSGNFEAYEKAGAILVDKHNDENGNEYESYHFDLENHSLYIRCRYYMEWNTYDNITDTFSEVQHKISEWSDTAIFSKENPGTIPEEPTIYEAPIISDLKICLPDESSTYSELAYIQKTPESVYLANVYYYMIGSGEFEGLETQVSINGGEWKEFYTADSNGDWCLTNGNRIAYKENNGIVEDTNVKLRIRFLGTHGPSEWSNEIEVNGGKINKTTESIQNVVNKAIKENKSEKEKCSLCGFCSVPFGLCIFIWIVIGLIVITIIILIIVKIKKGSKQQEEGNKE